MCFSLQNLRISCKFKYFTGMLMKCFYFSKTFIFVIVYIAYIHVYSYNFAIHCGIDDL